MAQTSGQKLTDSGNMSFLVRELHHAQAGVGRQLAEISHPTPRPRCSTDHRLPEVGGHDTHNHTSSTECDSARAPFHLPSETHQPLGQGKTRQRVPSSHSSSDAGQQIPGRQHVHEQDMGRSLGHLGTGSAHYGGGISQQHEIQPVHLKEEVGRLACHPGQVWNFLRQSIQHCVGHPAASTFAPGPSQFCALPTGLAARLAANANVVLAISYPLLQHTALAASGSIKCGVPDRTAA
jgi:hypothetical protein